MKSRRWLRIIPVALIMYTISYVDRTNIAIALTPKISNMMKDLAMDDQMKGQAAGIFFFGYVLLQIPGGYFATRWSARKVISFCLIGWGLCAIGCGLAKSFRQFEAARFLLGAAESGVFPAMLVLLANWFPRSERARANAYWNLCQPLAIVVAALTTGALLEHYGWRTVIVLEGMLPFLWLPIWWFFIRDRPREAKWIAAEEREHLETTLRQEAAAVEPPRKLSFLAKVCQPLVVILIAINFFHNCLAYGCMTFFTSSLEARGSWTLSAGEITDLSGVIDRMRRQSDPVSAWLWQKLSSNDQAMLAIYLPSVPRSNVDEGIVVESLNRIIEGPAIYDHERFNGVSLRPETTDLVRRSRAGPNLAQVNRLLLEDTYPRELSKIKGHGFSALQYGMLFAFPYTFTAVLMILVSRHSDKVNERRMHLGATYLVSGVALILSVSLRDHFWWSYAFLCVSIPGPSVALSPFWAIPSETLPAGTRGALMGLINGCGNLGGFVGPFIAGWLKKSSGSLELSFDALALGILIAACLTYWLPKTAPIQRP